MMQINLVTVFSIAKNLLVFEIAIIYFFFAEISPEVKSSCGSDGIFTETEDEGFFGGPNKSTTNIGWLVGVPSNGQFGIGYRVLRRRIKKPERVFV